MRLGDVMIVGLYLLGAGLLAVLILCAVGYCGAADVLIDRVESARRWMRRRRRGVALALGGDTVVAAGLELSKAARIMAAEDGRPRVPTWPGPVYPEKGWDDLDGTTVDLGPAPGATLAEVGAGLGVVRPWSWDDLPAWMPGSVRARFVGTFDPLPDRGGVEAEAGPALTEVGTYAECPLDNPDRAGELYRWEDDGGPAWEHPACETGAKPDPDPSPDRWQVVAVVQPDGAPELCCVVECLGCGTPNPSFRARCAKCGAHLATGEPHPAGEFGAGGGPRGTDTISGGASGMGGSVVVADTMPGVGQVALVLDRIKRETWGPGGQGPESVTLALSVTSNRWRVYAVDDNPAGLDPPGWWGLSEYRWTDDALIVAGYLRSQAQAMWEGEQTGQREEADDVVAALVGDTPQPHPAPVADVVDGVRAMVAADPACGVEVESLPSVGLVAGAIAQQRKLSRGNRTFRLWVYPGCVNDGDGWGVLAEDDAAPVGCRVVAHMTADVGESSRKLARRMLAWARATARLDDGLIEGARLLASGAD